ncbi:hypothetical protein [Spiroplasma endosymbiont of Polydrusus formosus]|uniref:hypothetical protein n=1 Tax=Spiroplasma endosymbiont of Polydrusus formosus TaxID=3139326 RepID=UPI0035B5001F
MAIFDNNKNEKYAYFLTNFKEILVGWLTIVNDYFIKSSLDNSSMKLFEMNVDKAIVFFDINLNYNSELRDLWIIKESYNIYLTNNLYLELRKKIRKKSQKIINLIIN